MNKHIGGSLDDMLREDGILEEVEAEAVLRMNEDSDHKTVKQDHEEGTCYLCDLIRATEQNDDLRAERDLQRVTIKRQQYELAECRERLLGIYDNLSDPPVSEEHMQAMCERIEQLFPDVFKGEV